MCNRRLVKQEERQTYLVVEDEITLGWFYSERRKGTGSRQYVGFVPAYTVWVWQPNGDDETPKLFDSFKDGKTWLLMERKG